jgi:hypothetical protein
MKKLLLASSAMVAAAAIASPAQAQVEVTVGGYYEAAFGFGDDDTISSNGETFGFWTDAEIHFGFRGMTDNGLTFGGKVEMEASNDGDNGGMDESFVFVSGDFGMVEIGFDDGANEQMNFGGTGAVTPFGVNDGTQTSFITDPVGLYGNGGLAYTGTGISAAGSSDPLMIFYQTPDFSGFQFGISYSPNPVSGGDANARDQFTDATRNLDYNNEIQAAITYEGEFDGVGVNASAGLAWANQPNQAAFGNLAAAGERDDWFGYNLGLQISYGGFTVGGAFAQQTSGTLMDPGAPPFTAAGGVESTGFDVGVAYASGPLAVGVSFFYGEAEVDTVNGAAVNFEAETYNVVGGVNYALGNGLNAYAGVGYTSFDNEASATSFLFNTANNGDNDGVWGFTGIVVSF